MRDFLARLWALTIFFAWMPLGLFALWIEKKLPKEYQLPFWVIVSIAVIVYYVLWIRRNEKFLKDRAK